jgi:hypothetical protein
LRKHQWNCPYGGSVTNFKEGNGSKATYDPEAPDPVLVAPVAEAVFDPV